MLSSGGTKSPYEVKLLNKAVINYLHWNFKNAEI